MQLTINDVLMSAFIISLFFMPFVVLSIGVKLFGVTGWKALYKKIVAKFNTFDHEEKK